MKFKNFLDVNPENDLLRMRYSKHQIDDYHEFASDLQKNHIDSSITFRKASDLIPTQRDFHVQKVKDMMNWGTWSDWPVTISNDDYVIDGHHRWCAALQLDETVKCHVVGMNIQECQDFIRDKPYTSKKGINESL